MDILKELLDLGIGTLSLSREKAEKAISKLIKKGKFGKKEGARFVDMLIERGDKERKIIQAELSKIARQTVAGLNLATKQEVLNLRKEVEKLKKHKH